jgi:hypothetical protein
MYPLENVTMEQEKMVKQPCINGNCQGGYNLLQMAMSILILGILAGSFIQIYNNYNQEKIRRTSYENLQLAMNTIHSFRVSNGSVPCPSPINDGRATATYGTSVNCNAGAIAALAPGQCAAGICIEESPRTTLPDGTPLTAAERRVVVGALPFRALQIDEKKAVDGYGNRLVYAVTQTMTVQLTVDERKGAIAIRNETGESVVSPDGSALYLVFSTGKNAIGAYSFDGQLVNTCAGAGQDVENCNDGFQTGTAVSTDAIYTSNFQSSAAGAAQFDDFLSYFSQTSQPLWKRTTPDPENIEDLALQNIGVGIRTPATALNITAGLGLDSLRANGTNSIDGTIFTDQLCDENGINCFDPLVLAGNNAIAGEGMKCPAATPYMTGISAGTPICTANMAVKCTDPAFPVMRRLYSFPGWGTWPECVAKPIAPCPTTAVALCAAGDVSLPAAASGTTSGPFTRGSCRTASYICSSGTWVIQPGSTGVCTFVAGPPTTTNPLCSTLPGFGFGWGGTATVTATATCSGSTATSTDTSTCYCNPDSAAASTSCSAFHGNPNLVGSVTWTKTATCPGPVITCGAATYTSATAATCPGLSTAGCSCPVNPTPYKYQSCPAGFIRDTDANLGPVVASIFNSTSQPANKGIYIPVTRNPGTCTDTDGAPVDHCVCNTTPTYAETPTPCADPVCDQPDTGTETFVTSIPTSITVGKGSDVYETTYDVATCTANASTKVKTGTCGPKPFKWVGVPTGTFAAAYPPSPKWLGQSCGCTDFTDTVPVASTKLCFDMTDPTRQRYKCKCQ